MIFLVLHEEGAIKYQEKREKASGATPINNNNPLLPVKRKLEDEFNTGTKRKS